jgi:hypothetical protein
MTKQQALKLAIKALDHEIQRFAFDAMLLEVLNLDTPATRNAAAKRKRYQAAQQVLQEETLGGQESPYPRHS